MKKLRALLGTLAFLATPATVGALVPWWISHWTFHPAFFGAGWLRAIGAVAIAFGAVVMLESFLRFALEGLGTPAPVAPTEELVVRGFYRYVRNPMYVALQFIILGQALVFGDVWLIVYAAAVWLTTHSFVILYEEPKLRKTYGSSYERYCASVPRWVPLTLGVRRG